MVQAFHTTVSVYNCPHAFSFQEPSLCSLVLLQSVGVPHIDTGQSFLYFSQKYCVMVYSIGIQFAN